jgi:hypothetical protein
MSAGAPQISPREAFPERTLPGHPRERVARLAEARDRAECLHIQEAIQRTGSPRSPIRRDNSLMTLSDYAALPGRRANIIQDFRTTQTRETLMRGDDHRNALAALIVTTWRPIGQHRLQAVK